MLRMLRYFVVLVLLILVAAATLRSFVSNEFISLARVDRAFTIATSDGLFFLVYNRVSFDSDPEYEAWRELMRTVQPQRTERWQLRWDVENRGVITPMPSVLGFGYESSSRQIGMRSGLTGVTRSVDAVQLPAWFALLALGGFPLFRLIQRSHVRRQRVEQGLCVSCGFDPGPGYLTCPRCGQNVRPDEIFSKGSTQVQR